MRFVILALVAITSFTTIAQEYPRAPGKRTVTLNCGGLVSQANGDFFMGEGYEVRTTLSTQELPSVYVQRNRHGANPLPEQAIAHGDNDNYFVTPSMKKVYLFRDTNCLKSGISAILLTEDGVANCTHILSDEFSGLDYDFCD